MNSNIQCSLKGSYKVDLFKDKKLVESTEWFSNDITNVGLNFPFYYSFAECFKFLSLGNGQWANNQNQTGLNGPISTFSAIDSNNNIYNQSGQYIGWQGYEINSKHGDGYSADSTKSNSACGTSIDQNGINFYRAWTLPTGAWENGTTFNQNLTVNSLMVSPNSGQAFSIVNRPLVINSGYVATITYNLSLQFPNYKKYSFFSGVYGDSGGYFDTGSAYLGINNSELSLLSGWSNLSGIYKLFIPGLQIVDALGASVKPTWGDQMEPKYNLCDKLLFYLTPDYSQFAISPIGATTTSLSGSYNSIGLIDNFNNYLTKLNDSQSAKLKYALVDSFPSDPDNWFYNQGSQLGGAGNQTIDNQPTNIKLNNLLDISNYNNPALTDNTKNYQQGFFPIKTNYPVAFATPGNIGFDSNSIDFGQRATFSTFLRRTPTGVNNTGDNLGNPIRYKKVTKTALFAPINCYGTNTRYASLVLGYNTNSSSYTICPYVDFLFFDNSGKAADMAHYRYITGFYFTERGTGIVSANISIVDQNGNKIDSINNFYNNYCFMGEGVSSSTNVSGIDVNAPLLVNPVNGFTGILCSGQILTQNAYGDPNYNSPTGFGSVYGIITSGNFGNYPQDICLIYSEPWYGTQFSGFVGDYGANSYPNPTGDSGKLYWINSQGQKQNLVVKINNLKYLVSGYPAISDTASYFNGTKQVLSGLTYTLNGTGLDITTPSNLVAPKYYFANQTTPFTNTTPLMNKGTATSNTLKVTGSNIYGSTIQLNIPINYTDDGTHNYFTGFGFSNVTSSRGYNFDSYGLSSSNIINFDISGTDMTFLNGTYYLTYFDGTTYWPLTGKFNFNYIPTNFKNPSANIYHVEYNGVTGNRLLPNYAIPNTGDSNVYSPILGGAFPGLSTENGLQIYFDFIWSA